MRVLFASPLTRTIQCKRSGHVIRHAIARRQQLSSRASSVRACDQRVITTPLYYVNAAPHMGSAYPTMAADALARFTRLTGRSATFITGCDEHGEKIAQAVARASDDSPQAFCDRVSQSFRELWEMLDIQYDVFVRTTSKHHASLVREFMERVWQNGDIYKSEYEGLYCTGCEEYKDEKELAEGNLCKTHRTKCESRKEENYFFALSKYQKRLEEFLEENRDFVLPLERRNEVLGWVRSGLRDFSVSRANNPWGIPVPRDQSQTIYVWFDALLGYMSALTQASNEPPALEQVIQKGWPADVHIIGKDILRFHAVYWPAMLMSAGLPLPKRVFGHGFITKNGLKMGKSLNNTLDPKDLVTAYGSDAVRYYFLKAVDFGRDGDFSEQRFIDIVNADLANSLGNLINRSVNLIVKNCGGIVSVPSADIGTSSSRMGEMVLREMAVNASSRARKAYDALNFVQACEAIIEISSAANTFIDRIAPWKLFKSTDPEDIESAKRCCIAVLEASRIVAVGLSPVTPKLSRKVYSALFMEEEYDGLRWQQAMDWGGIRSGLKLAKSKPVFPRLEMVVSVDPQPAAVV